MFTITDVSPTRSNMSFGSNWQDVTGRMLSLASSDDGKLVFAGSFSSGLWVSEDGGQSWVQLTWEQPAPDQFGVPGALGGCCIPSIAVGPESARWLVERNPRFLADITGDGRADIVGFGDTGVWTAISNGDGTFRPPRVMLPDFGPQAGGWRVDRHPRFLADITGDGKADIVGFGEAGVFVALSNGDGTFQPPRFVIADFGVRSGWRVENHPRFLADITGDGKADIVGFGEAGVFVASSKGDGTFQAPRFVLDNFGFRGGWWVEKHPRFLADITGDGKADIVGFGDAGVWTARSNGDGSFQPAQFVLTDLGFKAGFWRVEKHPRFLADINGDGRADIVGFGDAGVYVALANIDGSFPGPLRFVQPNFGHQRTVLALVRSDREVDDAGIWRSTNGGGTWSPVHSFPRPGGSPPAVGQLVWTPGSAHLVFAAGQDSLAVSRDAGATWQTATRRTSSTTQPPIPVPANHVAVAATPTGTLRPPAVYALASNKIEVSLDGGDTWVPDSGALPSPIGGAVGLANSQNECVMVVSPRSPFEVLVTRDANAHPNLPRLFRGDFSAFAQSKTSTWQDIPIPKVGSQDSGNVWLAITRPGQGEALFYGPQRYFADNIGEASVAPLDPQAESDWQELDTTGQTHLDLHGLFLSPDFRAGFDGDRYAATAGTVWMLSDGGIDRSTDGGLTFHPAGSISSLSTVNFAGAALLGQGPLLSLNTGDNDGFASRDGGRHWRPMHYGGGDNDTSWSDPLRPHSMLVFTPRSNKTVTLYETQPGNLPDISSTSHAQVIPGPPLRTGSNIWNASSGFGIRGYRPLVQNRASENPSLPTDYVCIRFYGNFARDDPFTRFPDHLAVLLRARDLRKIQKRTDWDTPGGWQVERHPRLLADLTGDVKADIVGFGDAGVWTALSRGSGLFADPQFVLADLGIQSGWRVEKHPRFLADITADGKADIVGFGDAGVWTALSNGDGTFRPPRFVIADFGVQSGWRVEKHPRFLADITGDGKADIVGFGEAGVFVALSNGDGTFQPPQFVIADLGVQSGWRVEKHPRFLADLTGDGKADIVGFGQAGVFVAVSNGDGSFSFTPQLALQDFGFEQGWRVEHHPRFLADVTGEGRADIVGFGEAGVLVSPTLDGGTFREQPLFVIPNLGHGKNGPVEQVGPFLPDPNIGVVQASGGREGTVFYVGNTMAKRLWKWTAGMAAWQQLVPGRGAGQAKRFFVSPYDPNLLYLIDDDRIKRSDDGGATWQVDASLERMVTCDGRIPANRDEFSDTTQVVLSDMQFDPFDRRRRFAVGLAGAFMTTDGATWERLLDTGAMRGLPTNCFFDQYSAPSSKSLYVGFAGRGIVRIGLGEDVILLTEPRDDETEPGPLERATSRVRLIDGRLGTAEAGPDERFFVTLDDGPTIMVDADEVAVLDASDSVSG